MPQPGAITPEIQDRMLEVGVDLSAHPQQRAGTYVHLNDRPLEARAEVDGLEVMDIKQALDRYEWLRDLYGTAVPRDRDEFTRAAEEELHGGYFIRALPGAQITVPVQACLYLLTEGMVQRVHNVIIAEEGSFLPIITGCTAHFGARRGMHIGISEFFVRRSATVKFIMIHAWNEEISVRPRSAAIVEGHGAFLSDYVCLERVRDVQMYPVARLVGEAATARYRSVVAAPAESNLDLGSGVRIEAPGGRAEILSRNVSTGGKIIARGRVEALAAGARGHLECRGLLMSEQGQIVAIPELTAAHPDVELSHEAAVGKIAEEEIHYLMARGLSRDAAIAAIVHGFLDLGIEGLPPVLQKRIDSLIALSDTEAMEGKQ
ncbi:MAG: SufD family Fe-S cluster assembly protein [Armatimonadetes bacterium]|nr:SufD family Fe-S cluster assembly protein [Armatimonadota bacterium]